jgi:hypothetical protein
VLDGSPLRYGWNDIICCRVYKTKMLTYADKKLTEELHPVTLKPLCRGRSEFLLPRDHQIFKTPVTDSTGNFLNRWISHCPGGAGVIMPAVAAFPFFAVKPLTAKNMFAMNAHSNHLFGPLVSL